MPQVDAQVVRAQKSFLVAGHADAVDVVGVRIRVRSTAPGSRLHLPANHLQLEAGPLRMEAILGVHTISSLWKMRFFCLISMSLRDTFAIRCIDLSSAGYC